MSETIFARIRELLDQHGIAYRVVEHAETFTSAESAAARGEALSTGGKALLLKADDRFMLAVLSADRKLDSRALQRILGARKMRFATREELAAETGGLVPGSVPPFGEPILSYPLYVDESIVGNERIAFNAALLTRSIVMSTTDYLAVARPIIGRFSQE